MRFVSKLSEEQWAEARRLRGEGANFTAIAKTLGISRDTISKRARREGWEAPAAAATPRQASRTKARDAAPLPNDIRQARRSLSRRILRILDLDLKIMEHRMQKRLNAAENEADPAGMSDDEVKRLGIFNKTIQVHTEHAPDTDRAVRGAATSAAAAAALASEADVFRRELAERIAKLIPPS